MLFRAKWLRRYLLGALLIPMLLIFVLLRGMALGAEQQLKADDRAIRLAWIGAAEQNPFYHRLGLNLKVRIDTQWTEEQAKQALAQDSLDGILILPPAWDTAVQGLGSLKLRYVHKGQAQKRYTLRYVEQQLKAMNEQLAAQRLERLGLPASVVKPLELEQQLEGKVAEENPLTLMMGWLQSGILFFLQLFFWFTLWLGLRGLVRQRVNTEYSAWMSLTMLRPKAHFLGQWSAMALVLGLGLGLNLLGFYAALQWTYPSFFDPLMIGLREHWVWSAVLLIWLTWLAAGAWLLQWRMALQGSWQRLVSVALLLGTLLGMLWQPVEPTWQLLVPIANVFWASKLLLAEGMAGLGLLPLLLWLGFLGTSLYRRA